MDTRPGTKYVSKRGNEIHAVMEYEKPEGGYVLSYLNGDSVGKHFEVSKSTLDRWWKVDNSYINPDIVNLGGISINMEKVNTPFETSEKKEIIKKPKSLRAEESKGLPTYEELQTILAEHEIPIAKVNKSYILFEDKTSITRRVYDVVLYMPEKTKDIMANYGFVYERNYGTDKVRPFKIVIENKSQFELLLEVLEKCMKHTS